MLLPLRKQEQQRANDSSHNATESSKRQPGDHTATGSGCPFCQTHERAAVTQ